MHLFSLLTLATAALAASIPGFRRENESTSTSQVRRSAEPGNIQLHKTVIPDWADDVYVAPNPNEYVYSEPLLRHQGNVIEVPNKRESSVIRVDPVEVPMYTETYPNPGVERHVISARESESDLDILERRVPTCIRKPGKLHTQRKWSISYDHDNKYNGMHCGQSDLCSQRRAESRRRDG
ncbi:hypothetical protein B0T21DRAFT_379357 [Apiosordaria backusii]|uniref:Uncharacterized protein n=1 Tax=Apiosordaria backusii TaxID=314023 RepID=A0AA40EX87_9PEZI|nr:hypothetical protein B0T21DRAFT_379357 [Apiosordaria backusii]